MDILKYFYEEPAGLEVLSADDDPDARRQGAAAVSLEALLAAPRYYRGYLAGTDLSAGRVGVTALAHPAAFVAPVQAWLAGLAWTACDARGEVAPVAPDGVAPLLLHPEGVVLLAGSEAPLPPQAVVEAAASPRRHALPALRRLLDAASVACFPEPAHDGYDWSFFSARPLRDAFVEALRRHPHPDVRRFVLPYRQARSEEKFYFERYALEAYAAFEVR